MMVSYTVEVKNIPNLRIKSDIAVSLLHNIFRYGMTARDILFKGDYSTKASEWIPPKLISDKYKFVYVVIPVTGSRSIRKKIHSKEDKDYEAKFVRDGRKNIKN